MRRRFLLIAMALLTVAGMQALPVRTDGQPMKPVEANPLNLNPANPQQVLDDFAREQALLTPIAAQGRSGQLPAKFTSPRRAAGDTVQYLVAAQNHLKNYQFSINGGDFVTWNAGVVVDGTKVTIANMFNLEAQGYSWNPYHDDPVEGVYDAVAKTLTIAANTSLTEATVVGGSSSSTVILISGPVTDDGKMAPEKNLVFDVETAADGTITKMTARYPIALPQYYGTTSYGNLNVYRQFTINLQGEDASLFAANDEMYLGEGFPGDVIAGTIQLVNVGGAEASYVVDIECDPEGYIVCENTAGEVPAGSTADLTFSLQGTDLNDNVEGIATVTYEGGNGEGSFDIVLTGKVIPYPDYSAAVKQGDFTFKTNIECPWEIKTDDEGTAWAFSGPKGRGSMTSDFYVYFSVPEGQMGTFSWTGNYKNDPSNRYYYSNYAGWFIDGNGSAAMSTSAQGDLSGELEFGPGEHSVRFQHQTMMYSGLENDGFYVKDLCLDLTVLDGDVAELKSETVQFGQFILDEGGAVDGDQTIVIQNRGANQLTLKSITSDNEEFTADENVEGVGTLQDMVIPVFFSTKVSGRKSATFTVETSAGTFTVPATANVIDMPDFSQIVTEGLEYMSFTTNPNHPFIVEDGKAFNLDWDEPDLVASQYGDYTQFQVIFDIPEGKQGILSWDGEVWGAYQKDPTDYAYWSQDHGMLEYNHQPLSGYGYGSSGSKQVFGVSDDESGDASSRVFSDDPSWAAAVNCVPGTHTFTFRYDHDGNGETFGKNRIEISNVRLRVIDFKDHDAQLLTEGTVEFAPTYVGPDRYTTATVQLKNIGSQILSVESITGESENSPFYGIVPEGYNNQVQYNNTVTLTLWFYPSETVEEDTEYTDNVIIKTNAGEFKVPVKGVAKGSKGILLVGDFEDFANGWTLYDRDGDGRDWSLGSGLWGTVPEYCHSGQQCLGSISGSNYDGNLEPDNWTFSFGFTVPEEGAVLTWYAAAHHHERYAENYSVYVEEDFSDASKLGDLTPVFTETLPAEAADEWQFHSIDLKDYAGKTVYLAFRHHDCTGQYILKLDDVFVYTSEKWNDITTGINATASGSSADVVSREYFNAAGQRVDRPVNGINIVRQTMKDGSVKSVKFMMKK